MMMKKTLLLPVLQLAFSLAAYSQTFVWGSTDVRYMRDEAPKAEKAPLLEAWRGERVNAQAIFVPDKDTDVTIWVSDLLDGWHVIPSYCVEPHFVEYVIADYYGKQGENVSLQPDRLVPGVDYKAEGGKTCPVWISVQVPDDVPAGRYKGDISVRFGGKELSLQLVVNVLKRTLPPSNKWFFHLDLWQNPYAVARYFDVPLWSQAHFDRMRPIMAKYASAGGKVITASIVSHPWNGQTYDPFESMIGKRKNIDGSWSYDYTVFDRWVEFMMSCGVSEQINCYTIVPWGYKFDYLDQATATVKYYECKPGDADYEEYMLPFLKDFSKHLRERGWFEKTCIAMDERPMDQFSAAKVVVRKADPKFRMAGAVNYSPEVADMMYDISVIYNHSSMPDNILNKRLVDNYRATIYTCCTPEHPNTFIFSPYAEAEFIGLSAAARYYGGYLRWALNSWPEDPCKDSRYGKWPGGDTYLLYPEGSSIRFERLMEGIQSYEKIRALRNENDAVINVRLSEILRPFTKVICDDSINAAVTVREAKKKLNALSRLAPLD